MASRRRKSNVSKIGPQSPGQKEHHGKRPQGFKEEREQRPVLKSPRPKQYLLERTVSKDSSADSPSSRIPGKKAKFPQKSPTLPQAKDRKRKQSQEEAKDAVEPLQKRSRTSLVNLSVEDSTVENTPGQEATSGVGGNEISPINYWVQRGHWPGKYFKENSSMNSLRARKKSSSSLRRKGSESSAATPSDEKPREEKSAPYKNWRYEIVLETKGSFMRESDAAITDDSRRLYQSLLDTEKPVPIDSRFRDGLFKKTCEMIRLRNETKVIMDIGQLIVASAETLALYGATDLNLLIEGFNEGWNKCMPFYGPRPQPDYAVGFRRSAFTDDQLEKLKPFIGDWDCTSFFMATDTLHFPFLTCEMKCGEVALDIADRQNAHSMTIAVRGVVELYRAVKREKELHQEILAFSISHDHTTVRIYGHYALIEEGKTSYYRHQIRNFVFTELSGKEKWTAYRFTRNIYDKFVPIHLNRICAAIDQLPADLDFEVSQSELQFSQHSNTESVSLLTTSFTQRSEQASKKPRMKQ